MKKMAALMLAFVMMMAMSMTAMAATITIGEGVDGQTYSAYKIFDVTTNGTSYAYTIDKESVWFDTVYDETAKVSKIAGLTITEIGETDKYNVTITGTFNDSAAATFASTLNAVLEENDDITTTTFITYKKGETETITVDDAGYYFVDSSLGSLCMLDTAVDKVTITEKNSLPSIEKEVKETGDYGTAEATDGVWGETAVASIGDSVDFKLTVKTDSHENTGANANNTTTGIDADYVITDALPDGMSMSSVDIENIAVSVTTGSGDSATTTTWVKDKDYSIEYTNNILTITLSKDGELSGCAKATPITITYNATLNDNAVIEGTGNKNTATLTYNTATDSDDATVYTCAFALVKVNEDGTKLADAKFELPFYVKSSGTANTYIYAGTTSGAGLTNEVTTGTEGEITIIGVDTGDYEIEETAAPVDYNKLTEPFTVTVNKLGITIPQDGNYTYTTYIDENGGVTNTETDKIVTYTNNNYAATVRTIVNMTGTELPSTGGIGTTIFYLLGGIMVVGTLVVLIVRRRMSVEN